MPAQYIKETGSFATTDKENLLNRINKLKEESRKNYVDDPPMALYYLLHGAMAKGNHLLADVVLTEFERLKGIESNVQKE